MITPEYPMQCPACGAQAALAFVHPILADREASYYLCRGCEFMFARPADWIEEAYSSALAITDTGAVQRAVHLSKILDAFCWFAGLRNARGLDVGGGHGLLVRMLRDRGLDFYWADEHAENLFARGFTDAGGEYEVVTLVEVFEHLVEPGAFLTELVRRRRPRCILLTTELRPEAVPPPDWWYWSFETGQHVGFATERSLEVLASALGYRYARRGGLHLFYKEPRHKLALALANSRLRRVHTLLALRFGSSLTIRDHQELVQVLRGSRTKGGARATGAAASNGCEPSGNRKR